MCIKNILALLCFLCIGVSCSMDNDILNDTGTNSPNNIDVSESYAAMSFSLAANEIETKASSVFDGEENPNGNEVAVINSYVAIFNQDTKELLASHLYSGDEIGKITDYAYPLASHIIFKVPSNENDYPNLKVVAIAQMNKNEGAYSEYSSITNGIMDCRDYSALIDFTLSEGPNVLVKVGEKDLLRSEYSKYVTVSDKILDLGDGKDTHEPFVIPVTQRSGAVELAAFDVKSSTGKVTDVQVNKLQLQNMALSAKVKNPIEESNQTYSNSALYSPTDVGGSLLNYRLYSYENVSPKYKAALYIEYSYKLDGKLETGTCDFTVKTPDTNAKEGYVEQLLASHLYKLDVTITNATVNVGVVCATMDWKFSEDNEFEFNFSDK